MDAREQARRLAEDGYGRKRIIDALAAQGVTLSDRQVKNIIQEVRGPGLAWGASPVTGVEILNPDEPPSVEDLLSLLHKRKGEGVTHRELTEFPDEALTVLERRGFTLALVAGRVRLEREPETRVNEEAVTGLFDPRRKTHRFAVITDTHFGGYQAQPEFVLSVLREAEARGCSAVLHVGDHLDGPPSMHKGFEYELGLTRADEQVDFAVNIYNQSQVPIIGITGNHDGSFFKSTGLDVGRLMAERCPQFTHIGPIQGWVAGPNGDQNFIRLFHPGDGCSYALSYKDQKTAEFLALSNDKAPAGFHFTGHYHKFNHMRGPSGARYFLAPAACGTTPFMRAKRLVNQSGALFLEFTLDAKGRVDRCIVEDVMLHPDQWTRCDYSQMAKPGKLASVNLWAA